MKAHEYLQYMGIFYLHQQQIFFTDLMLSNHLTAGAGLVALAVLHISFGLYLAENLSKYKMS